MELATNGPVMFLHPAMATLALVLLLQVVAGAIFEELAFARLLVPFAVPTAYTVMVYLAGSLNPTDSLFIIFWGQALLVSILSTASALAGKAARPDARAGAVLRAIIVPVNLAGFLFLLFYAETSARLETMLAAGIPGIIPPQELAIDGIWAWLPLVFDDKVNRFGWYGAIALTLMVFMSRVDSLVIAAKIRRLFGIHADEAAVASYVSGTRGHARTVDVCTAAAGIREFSTVLSGNEPDAVVDMLERWTTIWVDAVKKAGGTIDDVSGDVIAMSFAGDGGCDRAAACVESVRDALPAWLKQLRERSLPVPAGMEAGIHTGQAVSGVLGHGRWRRFVLFGRAPERADQLRQTSATMGLPLVLSDTAYQKLSPASRGRFRPVARVTLKGQRMPMRVYGSKATVPAAPGGHSA